MHVVVVDTNIVISTLLGRSFPYFITRELILKKKINCVISKEILTEYKQVISYKKFANFPKFEIESKKLIYEVNSIAITINPGNRFNILQDQDDNKFLELAYASNANFLITGNTKHFPFGKFHDTEIISPQKYWNTYWNY